jgi:hypothetical protein
LCNDDKFRVLYDKLVIGSLKMQSPALLWRKIVKLEGSECGKRVQQRNDIEMLDLLHRIGLRPEPCKRVIALGSRAVYTTCDTSSFVGDQ